MAINTYFKNIADAIRTKTGGSGLITPAEMPNEILNIQTGGSVDMSKIDYIGFIIIAQKGIDPYIQLDRLSLYDENNDLIPFSLNATYGIYGGDSVESGGQGAYAMWNNSDNIGNYRTILKKKQYQNFYMCYCKFNESQDFSDVYKYKWWTGGDIPARDPKTFGLIMANGNEKNGLLKMVDFARNITVTNDRNAVAYEGLIG